jgi:hypothetical protein
MVDRNATKLVLKKTCNKYFLTDNFIIFRNRTNRAARHTNESIMAMIMVFSGGKANFKIIYDNGKLSICNPPTIIWYALISPVAHIAVMSVLENVRHIVKISVNRTKTTAYSGTIFNHNFRMDSVSISMGNDRINRRYNE